MPSLKPVTTVTGASSNGSSSQPTSSTAPRCKGGGLPPLELA